jgi:hypothetical protein
MRDPKEQNHHKSKGPSSIFADFDEKSSQQKRKQQSK